MENLAHSLLGATFAELALPRGATTSQRRVYFVTGVIAANLPDADLLYTRITPPPLGYLLHHRGHTHTIVGAAVLGLAVWLVAIAFPRAREAVASARGRFAALIGLALASHLLADWWNSYGVHPFWPIDNRWYYGDSIFIVEPWFWVFLGTAAVMNTRHRIGRLVFGLALVAIPVGAFALHVLQAAVLVSLVVGSGVLGLITLRLPAQRRSAIAVGLVAAFVVGLFGLNRVARAAVADSIATLPVDQRGVIADLILSPEAARPVCWTVVSVERVAASQEYLVRRGSLSVWPSVARCGLGRAGVLWSGVVRESSSQLRAAFASDCWVRAWLQFGRAPALSADAIVDLRYGQAGAGNFSEMMLGANGCPPHVTSWIPPREDLLR